MRDFELLAKYRRRSCDACGKSGPCDPDHIGTRGAGWGDHDFNLHSLCRPCHTLRHTKGILYLVKKYPITFRHHLETKGWVIEKDKIRQKKFNKDGSEK